MSCSRRFVPYWTPSLLSRYENSGIATRLENNVYTPCILHASLDSLSLAGRLRARLEAGKRMIYRFRHGIIGPLALLWLTATVASVVVGVKLMVFGQVRTEKL